MIFFIGYFSFFCVAILVITRKTLGARLKILGVLYAVPVLMNILAMGFFGWNY